MVLLPCFNPSHRFIDPPFFVAKKELTSFGIQPIIATDCLLQTNFGKQAADSAKVLQPHKYRSKMKVPHLIRILFPVAMISVAAALPSQAQTTSQALTNGSFESQTPQLSTSGNVATGFSTVTGWADTSTAPTSGENSGVQGSANSNSAVAKPQSGSFFAFEKDGNPGAFQITGYTLAAGEQVTLTWYSLNSYQAPVQDVKILSASAQGTTFSSAATLADANGSTNTTYKLGNVPTAAPYYTEYTLTYTTTAADAGQFVGVSTSNISMANTTGNGDGYGDYLQTDNYTLAITTVPEPATYVAGMLTVGMAAGLIVTRRRKQTLSKSMSV